ncbi:hypothetical protein IKF76_01330 [Candidatus Saccharibacteria bacterium]|nr:hypothetical protein [Candidatus Saccharibacteria bacterium]
MRKVKLGDTIVEVVFAITVFALVAVISIGLMNSGVANAQATLEITMARNEIDAQAEALRFLHNAFIFEREFSDEKLGVNKDDRTSNKWYAELWRMLTRPADDPTVVNGLANMPDRVAPFNIDSCSDAYKTNPTIFENRAFVLNTRQLTPNTAITGGNDQVVFTSRKHPHDFVETPLYPRIIFSQKGTTSDSNSDELLEQDEYRFISRVEGIWVISVRDAVHNVPEFFDFHIRTCWYAPGRPTPTTIGTIVRLYNPEYVEASR